MAELSTVLLPARIFFGGGTGVLDDTQLKAPAKETKAKALWQAMLKVMKNPATSHPFYRADFVLVGDGG